MQRLHSVSQLLIRASLALFTCVVLVLIQSAFWSTRVSAWMQAIIFATALLSYFRPHYGLLALAALAPLGQVGSRTLDSHMRGAEALVLAFLAGALVRGWTLRGFRTFPSTRLEIAALVFGYVVAASCIEQLWFTQIQMDFLWPYTQSLLSYASRNYLTSSRGFGPLYRAMLLLEGLALLLCAVRYVKNSSEFSNRLVIFLIVGAVSTSALTFWAIAGDLQQTRDTALSVADLIASGRWSGHVSDVNAAGSYFAMTAMLALGVGLQKREFRSRWLAAGTMLVVTMLMTASRTAVAAAGMLTLLFCIRLAITHASSSVRAFSAASALIAIAGSAFLIFRTTGATPSLALGIRWAFLETTAHMLTAEPAFGVGIGQYSLWSAHFAPPALFQLWRPDNAHNNFAQIAGELGFVGLAAFLVVLVVSLRDRPGTPAVSSFRGPLRAGLAAFILTWLGGHPLLVPEVAFPFWITLGITAALTQIDSTKLASPAIIAGAVGFLLMSIPFRVNAKSADLDFSRVTYGLSPRQVMTSRARYFVPASESRLEFPIRARGATDGEPIDVHVFVDGFPSETVTLTDRNWRTVVIGLHADSTRRFHQIDLRIRPETLNTIDPERSSVEVGKWEIISKPNG